MVSCLFGVKPLPEPMLTYHQVDPQVPISMTLETKYKNFHSRKPIWKCYHSRKHIWKCYLQNVGNFDSGLKVSKSTQTFHSHRDTVLAVWVPHVEMWASGIQRTASDGSQRFCKTIMTFTENSLCRQIPIKSSNKLLVLFIKPLYDFWGEIFSSHFGISNHNLTLKRHRYLKSVFMEDKDLFVQIR